jgi:hypothetical protein
MATPEDRREYASWIMSCGGGLITTGNHLGVFVSRQENLDRCPPGWVFVDVETTTLDQLCEAIEVASRGRKLWPKNAKEELSNEQASRKGAG